MWCGGSPVPCEGRGCSSVLGIVSGRLSGAGLSLLLAVAGTIKMNIMEVSHIKRGCTHYCGRAGSYKPGMGIDMSILGNPYPMKNRSEEERRRVIAEHRVYLNKCRQEDNEVWKALLSLPEDAVLGCFCDPLLCHCHTLASAYQWAQSN